MSSPGSVSDLLAFEECSLSSQVERLPVGVYILADNAYMHSEHFLTPFAGAGFISAEDAYNFYLSQLRIRIEMAFGLLYTKWRLFRRPLEGRLRNTTLAIRAASRTSSGQPGGPCATQRRGADGYGFSFRVTVSIRSEATLCCAD